jgi:hypothetical protein
VGIVTPVFVGYFHRVSVSKGKPKARETWMLLGGGGNPSTVGQKLKLSLGCPMEKDGESWAGRSLTGSTGT